MPWMPRPPVPSSPQTPPRRDRGEAFDPNDARALVDAALEEDLGRSTGDAAELCARDLTVAAVVPADARAEADVYAKCSGVVAGLDLFRAVFERLDPDLRFEVLCGDGASFGPGDVLARLRGNTRALLVGERTGLNFLQRTSGVATLTAEMVAAAGSGGGTVRVLDTRKTTPGWRALERHAVRCGGGENHRYSLDDEIMIKDNHADFVQGAAKEPAARLSELVTRCLEHTGGRVRITAEARDLASARAALEAGAHVLLLDNFEPEPLGEVCRALRARAAELGRTVQLEASGGIRLETVAAFAKAGVDRVSVGALTHSARALDLSFEMRPLEGGER